MIIHTKALHLMPAESLLNLPSRHIGIDQCRPRRSSKNRPRANDKNLLASIQVNVFSFFDFVNVEEIIDSQASEITEKNIVSHKRLSH